jgi:hypothetical protein
VKKKHGKIVKATTSGSSATSTTQTATP